MAARLVDHLQMVGQFEMYVARWCIKLFCVPKGRFE